MNYETHPLPTSLAEAHRILAAVIDQDHKEKMNSLEFIPFLTELVLPEWITFDMFEKALALATQGSPMPSIPLQDLAWVTHWSPRPPLHPQELDPGDLMFHGRKIVKPSSSNMVVSDV